MFVPINKFYLLLLTSTDTYQLGLVDAKMHPNHALHYGSNLGQFREPSPNVVLESYCPEVDYEIPHGLNSEGSSKLSSLPNHSWDSIHVSLLHKPYIENFIYYLAESSIFPLKIATQHMDNKLAGKLFSSSTS